MKPFQENQNPNGSDYEFKLDQDKNNFNAPNLDIFTGQKNQVDDDKKRQYSDMSEKLNAIPSEKGYKNPLEQVTYLVNRNYILNYIQQNQQRYSKKTLLSYQGYNENIFKEDMVLINEDRFNWSLIAKKCPASIKARSEMIKQITNLEELEYVEEIKYIEKSH